MLIPSSSLLFPLCFFVAGIHAAPIGMPTNLQVRAEMVQLIEQRSLPSLLPIELERRDLDMDLERRDFEAANFERCDNFHLARLERRFKLKSKKSGGDGKVIFDALGKIFGRLSRSQTVKKVAGDGAARVGDAVTTRISNKVSGNKGWSAIPQTISDAIQGSYGYDNMPWVAPVGEAY